MLIKNDRCLLVGLLVLLLESRYYKCIKCGDSRSKFWFGTNYVNIGSGIYYLLFYKCF